MKVLKEQEIEINLKDYLETLRKRKGTILTCFLVVLGTVIIATICTTPIYEATTQILVEKNTTIPFTENRYSNYREILGFYTTQSQLIQSENVVRKVVAQHRLDADYDYYYPETNSYIFRIKKVVGGLKNWGVGLFSGKKLEKNNQDVKDNNRSTADILIKSIRNHIDVTLVEESHLFNITFRSQHPQYAALIVNAIPEAYKEEMMAIQHDSSEFALKWIAKKANEEKDKLSKSEEVLQEFMKGHDFITIEDRVAIIPQRLSDLTSALSRIQEKRKKIKIQYERIVALQKAKGDLETLPSLATHSGLQELREKVRKAEQHVLELKQEYGSRHPVMKKATAELRELQKKKVQEIDIILESRKIEYDLSKSLEESTLQELSDIKKEALLLTDNLTKYNALKREVESNRALYNALVKQIKEKNISEEISQVNVWTTQLAEIPETPVKPNKTQNILLGLILGILGGVGLAFFQEYLDNTIQDPEKTENRLGVSVLASIEQLDNGINPLTYMQEEPHSSFTESYKSLRTNILLSSAEAPPKHILVTSMLPDEGKTTVSANLARVIAQTERSVLIIDTDLRRPSIHKAFGLDNEQGLSSCFIGEELSKMVVYDQDTGVSVLAAGPVPPNPGELLGSERFAGFVELLGCEYDSIIFDSSPVFAATDTLLISKIVNGTLFVCRSEQTTFDIVKKGLKEFERINSKVFGVVINCMDMKHNLNYPFYYGYHQYRNKKG